MSDIRDCRDIEDLLCGYLDRTLDPRARAAFESHLATCPACAEFIHDAAAGMQFLSAAEEVEAPPYLVNRILHAAPSKWSEKLARRDGFRGYLNRLLAPVLQPRFVMGAMMTVLSLAMMTRCAGKPNHPLTASDLDPAKVWASFDDRLHRTWERTMKTYESMRVVYEVQSRVREWKQQDPDPAAAADAAIESKKLNGKPAAARNAPAADTQPTQ